MRIKRHGSDYKNSPPLPSTRDDSTETRSYPCGYRLRKTFALRTVGPRSRSCTRRFCKTDRLRPSSAASRTNCTHLLSRRRIFLFVRSRFSNVGRRRTKRPGSYRFRRTGKTKNRICVCTCARPPDRRVRLLGSPPTGHAVKIKSTRWARVSTSFIT